ncbi:nodal homolog [Eudromia elegans]
MEVPVSPGLLRHGSRWALSFDLSPLRGAPEPQLAELRLRLPEPWRSRNLTLELYHSPREPCGGCARRLLLATLPGASAAAEASWDVLDVTGALRAWLRPAPAPQGAPVGTAGPEPPADVAERVLLLVFSAEPSPPGACSLLRAADASKHVARAGGSAGTRRRRRNRKEKQRVKASEDAGALCRRVDMVVDFEQTGWGSWIVYPKKYNAYRCEGQCPSPVDESFKPTNHAYIQSLLGLYKPGHVPCPACSPVRTSPLSMLYYEKGELALRHHEDMVVEECGCH